MHPALLPMLLVLAACPKKEPVAPAADSSSEPTAPVVRHPPLGAGLNDSGWNRQEIDFNGDGKPEIVNWTAGNTVRKKEADLNNDGHMDIVTWFDGSGTIEAEEMDGDFDGRIDWVDHYTNGLRVKAEADTDFDGRVDVVFNYASDGSMASRERL